MRFLAILLVFSGFVSFGQQAGPKPEDILFTVRQPFRGKPIKMPVTKSEFSYLYKKNHTKKEDFTVAKEDEYLNLLINFKLKIAEARARGLDTTAAFKKEFNTYKEELKRPYLAENDELTRLTKEAYDHLKEEILASHILIAVKADAFPADTLAAYNKIVLIRKRALAGEDFEKLAREFSEDPSVKQNGGSLGYFTSFQMVYAFERLAYKTPLGQISEITRSRFGYHILKVFDRIPSRGEIEVSHILLRTGTANDAKVKDKIFEIYDQLKANRPWDELVKEYSEDTNTKDSGGKLRAFGPRVYESVPEFEQIAFSLKTPGEISDPFQSKVGWHIIRLEKKIPLLPYPEMEAALKRKVARDERMQLSKLKSLQKRKKELGFTEYRTWIDTYKADSTIFSRHWAHPVTVSNQYQPMFEIGGQSFLPSQFADFVNVHHAVGKQTPQTWLNQMYTQFTDEKINEAEEAKIVREHPEYKLLLSEYEEGILLFEIMEKEVWNKASEDSVGQRKFFNEHAAKYKAGDRVEARIFVTADKAYFDSIHAKIAKGDSITAADVKKFKSVQNLRAWERGESKIIDKIDWVPGVRETQADGNYYIVDVIRLIAPGMKSFEEARSGIISDYQDALEKNWLTELRKKYPVSVNKKAKTAVIAELNK